MQLLYLEYKSFKNDENEFIDLSKNCKFYKNFKLNK